MQPLAEVQPQSPEVGPREGEASAVREVLAVEDGEGDVDAHVDVVGRTPPHQVDSQSFLQTVVSEWLHCANTIHDVTYTLFFATYLRTTTEGHIDSS